MQCVDFKIVKLTETATLPTYSHPSDAGMDLVADEEAYLAPGDRALVSTGIAVDIPLGYVGLIHPRSGLAAKAGLTVLNAPGTIDAGYRGEVKVILMNHSREPYEIHRGDRIAQLVVQQVVYGYVMETESFEGFTERESAGFGSTGR